MPSGLEAEGKSATGSKRPARYRVVIVDDSPEALDTSARYLTLKGLDVVTSTHGFTLSGSLIRNPPDVLVLDVMMPALSGGSLAELIRKHAPGVAIVFFSAVPEDQGQRLVRDHAGARFVHKSGGVTALYRELMDVLNRLPEAATG